MIRFFGQTDIQRERNDRLKRIFCIPRRDSNDFVFNRHARIFNTGRQDVGKLFRQVDGQPGIDLLGCENSLPFSNLAGVVAKLGVCHRKPSS